MNRKKKFLMSPLNSTNSKSFTLQQIKTILQSQFTNVQFSFLLFSIYVLSILLKMSVLSFFLSFFFHMLCSTMFKFFFFFFYFVFFSFSPSSLSCSFFVFVLVFISFFFLFFIINGSFNVPCFSNLISTSLCPYLNTLTIGSLPSLFTFSL